MSKTHHIRDIRFVIKEIIWKGVYNGTYWFILTLELLMNKTTRQKYVEYSDPVLHEEEKTFKEKVEKFSKRILDITKAYLENPDKQVTLDMNHAFYEYAKRCIAHFYTF